MRKYLLADIVKAVSDEVRAEIERLAKNYKVSFDQASLIYDGMNRYGLDSDTAACLLINFPNLSDWNDVLQTAEDMEIDPCEVTEDDVWAAQEGAGIKGEDNSSIGIIQWLYDNTLKAYIVYIALTNNSNPKLEPTDVLYRIEPDLMKEWSESSSMGEFYNNNIRSNKSLEDPAISCGCGPNPCEQGQIDQFNTKYNNLP